MIHITIILMVFMIIFHHIHITTRIILKAFMLTIIITTNIQHPRYHQLLQKCHHPNRHQSHVSRNTVTFILVANCGTYRYISRSGSVFTYSGLFSNRLQDIRYIIVQIHCLDGIFTYISKTFLG